MAGFMNDGGDFGNMNGAGDFNYMNGAGDFGDMSDMLDMSLFEGQEMQGFGGMQFGDINDMTQAGGQGYGGSDGTMSNSNSQVATPSPYGGSEGTLSNGNSQVATPVPSMQQPNPQQQTTPPTEAFWNTANTMFLRSGEMVVDINKNLFKFHEELRPAIVDMWNTQQAQAQGGMFTAPAQPQVFQYQDPTANYQQSYAYPQGQAAAMPAYGYGSAGAYQQAPAPAPAQALNNGAGSKRKRGTPAPAPLSMPSYQVAGDLDSAADAREYLSRFDESEAVLLNIKNDDVAHVKANLHDYARKAYDAFLQPYDRYPDLSDDRQTKYVEQMESATTSLYKLVSTRAQIKAAKACAILLVDAAIAVHETGVSAARYDQHHNALARNTKSDDAYKIDTTSRCSARVDAMIAIVSENKLVAKDVLEQKNILRFAECPEAYLGRKFAYMRSNKTRQDKINERVEVDYVNGITGRGSRMEKRGRGNGGKVVYRGHPDAAYRP